MLQPGTSALFLVADKITTDKALDALSKYGGKVLKSSLSKDASSSSSRHWQEPPARRRLRSRPPPQRRPDD